MIERRRDERRAAGIRGIIKFGASGQELVCAVDDLTTRGAGLRVGSIFGLPQVFQLLIEGESMARHCRVIWIDGKKLGVSFE